MTPADIARVDDLSVEAAIHFRDESRAARARALQDAEAFQAIIQTVERLGEYLKGRRGRGLWGYRLFLNHLARKSVLANRSPVSHPDVHPPFLNLLANVADARNAAIHEGTYARMLTTHSVELSLVLEDALMSKRTRVRDYMVQEVTIAAPWQPLSLVRHALLANSYSFLPIHMGAGEWMLVSDYGLARYLKSGTDDEVRMNQTESVSVIGTAMGRAMILLLGGTRPAPHFLSPSAQLSPTQTTRACYELAAERANWLSMSMAKAT